MKKVICGFLIFVLCGAITSCKNERDDFTPLSDISHKKVDEKHVRVSGEVYSLQKSGNGFLLQYSTQNPNKHYLCFQDENNNVIWEHEISSTVDSLHLLGDDGTFIRTNDGFVCLDKNGPALWQIERFDDYFNMNAVFSDHAGGVYLLGRDLNTDYQCTVYHIDRNGQIVSCEPFEKIENLYALFSWPGVDGGYWLSGTRSTADKPFLSKMDVNFNVIKTFEFLERQYPTIDFLPEDNRIILYGQAYTTDSHKEYGFVYEIDYNMNQKKYIEFDDYVPRSVIKLKDNRWLVSCYDREKATVDIVKLFNAEWEEISTIKIEYSFTTLFALDDGGFAIAGSRLLPGQPDGALFMNSVRPKLDLIYERYNANTKLLCRKTYSAKNSNSGYGYHSFVDDNGKIYLF